MKSPNILKSIREHPLAAAALASGALALYGCGASPERVSNETSASTPVPAMAGPAGESGKIKDDITPTPTPEASEASSNGEVAGLVDAITTAGWLGDTGPVIEDETALEAIMAISKAHEDLLSDKNITLEQLKFVIENGSPEQVRIVIKDDVLPEEEWPQINPGDQVRAGDVFEYHLNTDTAKAE